MSHPCVPGSIGGIGRTIDSYDPEAVLLFTGGSSFEASGAADAVLPPIASCSVEHLRVTNPDPTLEELDAAIEVFRDFDPDIVVAVGGGSVLDLAKAVRALGPLAAEARPFLSGAEDIEDPDVPLIAVPTTAGTGSEATRYSVITIDGVKKSISDPALHPSDVIIDPDLLASVPPPVAASTGLDALAQAMESMWSTKATDTSYAQARAALRLALDNIVDVATNPTADARAGMMEASHLAGHAIDISATSAPHAFSYRLTTDHGVPHGHAVALTLGAVIEFNAEASNDDCQHPRGLAHLRTVIDDILGLLGVSTPAEGRRRVHDLIGQLGLEPTLEGVGAGSSKARRALAFSASPVRLATNPRRFDDASKLHLIRSIP